MSSKKLFWSGLGLLILEVFFFITLMVFLVPLKEILPIYFIIIIGMLSGSILLINKAKKLDSEILPVLMSFTAGMIWWTTSEMNAEAFSGSGIEDQAGLILLILAVTVFVTCFKDINKSSQAAIATFGCNWGAHMIIKMLCHMRNPADPHFCPDPTNPFNVIGLIYGFLSLTGLAVLLIQGIRKGYKAERAPYFSLLAYALFLNLIYIFAKGLFQF